MKPLCSEPLNDVAAGANRSRFIDTKKIANNKH
jgi:hypothetical protein